MGKITKIYVWIRAIPTSNIKNPNPKIDTMIMVGVDVSTIPPTKVIKIVPVVILADNRTDIVRGRIIILTISTSTIKGLNILGVPLGSRWIIVCLGSYEKLRRIVVNQNGKAYATLIAIIVVIGKV